MKHCITSLLSGVAIMAGTLSANAQWTVNPDMNSTVETLPKIELRSSDRNKEVDLDQDSNPAVTITKDGQTVTNITASYASSFSDYYLCNLNFTPEITEPGEYIISIPANSVKLITSMGDDAGYLIDYNVNIAYTVTGKGGDTPLQPAEYTMQLSWISPTTIDVSGEVYPGNIQLPDGAKAVAGASAFLRNTSVGYMEEVPVSANQLMPGYNYGMVQLGSVSKPVYNGTYTLVVPQGTFGDELFISSNGENGVANAQFTVDLTVTGGQDDPNAPDQPGQNDVSYTLEYKAITGNDTPQDIAGSIHAIAIQYGPDVNILNAAAKARLVNIESGYDQEVGVRFFDAAFMGGDLSQLNILLQNLEQDQLPTTMGTYSLIIPEGIVGNPEYISSNGEKGIANASMTIPVIFTDSKAGQVTEVTIERIQYRTDKTFEDLLENQEWAVWEEDSKLVFKTDNNDAIGYIHLTVTDKNPLNPSEAIVRTLESHALRTLPEKRGVYWEDGEDPFLQLGAKSLQFIAGHEYEIKGEIYDFENPPYERTQLAEFSYNVIGTTPGYQYALDIQQVSIEPDPETFIIQSVEQGKFTITYNAPVRLNKAVTVGSNGGGGDVFDLSTVVYNEDHTAFTVTIPASVIESANAVIPIALYVSDLEGHSLFFGADMGDNSFFTVEYMCYMGVPKLLLYPTEEGPEDGKIPSSLTVDEIKDLYISVPGGPASGEIHWSYFGGISVTDLSGDRVFATFDMNKLQTVKSYHDNTDDVDVPTMFKASLDEAITAPGLYVVNVAASTFNFGNQFDSSVSGPTFLTLTIEGESADNTVYDFSPVNISEPVFNAAEDEATITLTFPDDVEVNSDLFNEITLKDAEGELVEGAKFESRWDNDNYKLWYVVVKYAFQPNTVYTVDVPKGVFGDSDWNNAAEQYTEGRANPAFTISLDATNVGVVGVSAEDGEAVYYNLQGVRVENPESGIYVCVKNGKATKVNIRK